jgi:protein ImuB
MYAAIHAPAASDSLLAECARGFSPRLESAGASTVVLDADGLGRLFGAPGELGRAILRRAAEMGLAASVAVAATPEAAMHAARGFRGLTVVPPGSEAERLGKLPVEVLRLSPEAGETLARWGIKTLGELATLPEEGLAERLGPEGSRWHGLARGGGGRPLVPELSAPVFEETLELEDAVELLEPLAFLLARLLGDLMARLASYGLAPQQLHLRLKLAEGGEHARVLRLPVPIRDSRALLKLLRLDLETHPPQAPVVGVTLAAEPGRPRFLQDGLFLPPAPEPAKLELTLKRIAGLVGEGRVGWPEVLDTHRPDAFRLCRNQGQHGAMPADRHPEAWKRGADPWSAAGPPGPASAGPRARRGLGARPTFPRETELSPISSAPRLVLRRFRPPVKAEVDAPEGRPARVVTRRAHGRVLALAGPWRTSGEWWRPDAWDRDEFDVALSDGALYRLYRDRIWNRWFLEGSYD